MFGDVKELEAGLKKLADSAQQTDSEEPAASARIAFAYTGQAGQWAGMGEALYQTEPVARAVLDRCDQVMREERGASLLDVMFGRTEAGEELNDEGWAQAASYALEAALTALWESVGVRPNEVVGLGVGEIAAAQAAGVFGLEDGLRLAMSLTGPEADVPRIAMAEPSLTLTSSVTGRAVKASAELDDVHWRQATDEAAGSQTFTKALASVGADIVVEVGPQTKVDATAAAPEGFEERFLRAVSAAYEAGARISFSGLYAGEERRRISIPGYPFQRRRFWVQPRRRGGT